MQRMTDRLTIKAKTLLAFGMVLVLICGLGLTALSRLAAINTRAGEIRDRWLPSTGLQGQILSSIQQIRLMEARYSIALDEGSRLQIKHEITDERRSLAGLRADYGHVLHRGTADERFMIAFDHAWSLHEAVTSSDMGPGGDPENLFSDSESQSYAAAYEASKSDLDFNLREGRRAATQGAAIYGPTKRVVIGVLGVAVAICILLATAIVRNVSHPICRITDSMRRLAGNHLDTEIPGLQRRDELGGMAAAVRVFKSVMLERDRLSADREREHKARTNKADRIEELLRDFESKAGAMTGLLSEASAELEATALGMTNSAGQTNHQAGQVASAAAVASSGVQTVAAAVEQLTASVAEISRQIDESSSLTRRAVEGARRTDDTVGELAEAADRVGRVVELISRIAGQTNLLALNATIEAARAGNAGRGFAVVASEVKTLASQTASATREIASQVDSIQSATRNAVASIREIAITIEDLGQIAAAVANAAKEQGAATLEIAHNAQSTAEATEMVTRNIAGVSMSANETGAAAGQVLGSASGLAKQADDLSEEVTGFLQGIRAA